MGIANLNTADFIKGSGISQDGKVIIISDPIADNITGFQGQAYAVWTGSGLSFNVYWPSYYIEGVLYNSGSDTITLSAADGTYDRFDVIAVDSTGAISITGDPSADPIKPTVDNLTQLEITTILVGAGATTPSLISNEDVYKENTEWTGTSDISSADFNSTVDPFAGTKHFQSGLFSNAQYVKFTDASTHDISDYSYLKFYVRLRGTFTSTTGFVIHFRNGSTQVSSKFSITNGIYGFDRTDVSGYQLIVVPLNEFTFTSATFDTVYFEMKDTNSFGFRLDNIVLQGGLSGASTLQNAITTIQTDSGAVVSDQANDAIQILGGTNVTVSATGKVITIDATTGGSGTINSGAQYRIPYYSNNTTGTVLDPISAITANRALISDANGLPTHSSVTSTQLGYLSGVTSAIQTQLDGKLGTGLAWLLASGGTLTGNNTITGTGFTLTGLWTSLGTTQTDGYGLWLRNTTAAAAGAQQVSPSIVLEGQGWKTTATAASQTVKWSIDCLPVQGTANPSTQLRLRYSINGGAYTTGAVFSSVSGVDTSLALNQISGLTGGTALSFGAGQSFGSANSQLQTLVLGGTSPVTSMYINTASNLTATSGEQSLLGFSVSQTGGTQAAFAPTSGTAIFNNLTMKPIINQTGGANGNVRMINIEPTYTAAGGSVFGLRYAPTVTSITGQHFARYHNSGFIAWDSVLSPAQITSNQNDYAPNGWNNSSAAPYGASILRLSTDASRDLTGLSGGTSGRLVIISNVGAFDLVIKDESASSTAANRFALNADITINPDEGLMFWYDGTSSRWRALSI